MLDINLFLKNECYEFDISKQVRVKLYELRKDPEVYLPKQFDVITKKPIIKIFGGSVKLLPVCFAKFNTSVVMENRKKPGRITTTVFLNYYSKFVVGDTYYMPDNLYINTLLGSTAIIGTISIGYNTLTMIGNGKPTIINIDRLNKQITSDYNRIYDQIQLYMDKYNDPLNKITRMHNIGLRCLFCSRKDNCI